MTQSTFDSQKEARPGGATPKMSLQKKRLAISLFAIVATAAYYFSNVFKLVQSEELWQTTVALPTGYWQTAIGAIVLITVIEVILHIVLAAGTRRMPAPTQHDRDVALKAKSHAYTVMAVGAILTVGALFMLPSPFLMANLLLFFFVLAEVTRHASQLFSSSHINTI